ncbi:MAG: hypothetical protein EA383_07405 [Spirochaetaceae bacterium]|nr:MAG: hypothetical protein EA383_07405 [Spirochaetaceae bacterium]
MQKIVYYVAIGIGAAFAVIGFSLFMIFTLSPQGLSHAGLSDIASASHFGQFIGGFLGPLFSIVTSFLLFATLINQSTINGRVAFESSFYKMLDYHFQHISSLMVKHVKNTESQYEPVTGKRAFIVFKLHLERLLEIVRQASDDLELALSDDEIIDIACIAFYYGILDENQDFLLGKLRRYESHEALVQYLTASKRSHLENDNEYVGRANQTNLSSYFRNMYHLIKYVDSQRILSAREKIRYVNILRAQLSDSELWLLYFNVASRFGKKWQENGYLMKYRLIRNLPSGFCYPFDPSEKFPMEYVDYELSSAGKP